MERLTSRNALERWTSESETPELEEFVMIRGRALGRAYFESDRDYKDYCDALDKLAACEDLEEQGRLIVLPCKVGDTVYTFYNGKNCKWPTNMKRRKIYETLVSGIRLHDWDADDWRLLLLFDTREASGCYEFSFSEVGKTVFLTSAEAEKAMEVSEDA